MAMSLSTLINSAGTTATRSLAGIAGAITAAVVVAAVQIHVDAQVTAGAGLVDLAWLVWVLLLALLLLQHTRLARGENAQDSVRKFRIGVSHNVPSATLLLHTNKNSRK